VWRLYAHNTSSNLWKYPTTFSGEASRGGASSWPARVVSISTARWWLNYFFSTLFSLSFTHQELQNVITFCIISIVVFFYCFVFAFKFLLWFIYFFNFIFYHFIFMTDLIIFLLIDIYFVFHPSFNWFFFQFHTWFLFFLNLVPVLFIISSFSFIYFFN